MDLYSDFDPLLVCKNITFKDFDKRLCKWCTSLANNKGGYGGCKSSPALNLKVKTEKSYNNETAQKKKRIDRGY